MSNSLDSLHIINTVDGAFDVLSGHFVEPEALAAALGTSIRTLQRWHRLRQGPPRIVIGKRVLYRIEAVRDWLASRETNPAEAPRRRRGGV